MVRSSKKFRSRAGGSRWHPNLETLESRELLSSADSFDFLNGFNGTAFALNRGAAYVGTELQLTNNFNQARSAYYGAKVPVSSFTVDFRFRLTAADADGFTFCIQGNGPAAAGGSGSGLGYQNINRSLAVKFDLNDNAGEGNNSTGLYLNGAAPTNSGSINLDGTGIDLHSGHEFLVRVAYDGGTLQVTETDVVTGAQATQTYADVNIAGVVGASKAYVGFTAGTGARRATQHILGFGFTDTSGSVKTGINVGAPLDFSQERLFADAMKTSRDWSRVGTLDGAAPINADGWPTADASVVVWHGIDTMQGTYRLRFNGQATVVGSWGSHTLTNQQYDAATNTTTATLRYNSTDGSGLYLTFTNTRRTPESSLNSGVTGVQLMRPLTPGATQSYGYTAVFTNQIKALMSKFGVIRFMDYLATNSNQQVNWSDRLLPGYASQQRSGPGYGWQGKGGAWEYAVLLSNQTGRDLYINIPELATDDYIRNLALLIRYGSDGVNPYTSPQTNPRYPPLGADLKVYVEYSNEIWNFAGAFQQSHQNCRAARVESGLADRACDPESDEDDGRPNGPLAYDWDLVPQDQRPNEYELAMRRHAKRTKEASDVFRGVFGDAQMGSRVRPLLEWQYGGAWGEAGLRFLDNYYNNRAGSFVAAPRPVNYYLWGGGGGWYSSVNDPSAATIDAMYASGLSDITTVQQDADLARSYGLKVVGYEGGFQVGGDTPTPLQLQANLDPRAEGLTRDTLERFYRYGGDLPVVFNAGSGAYAVAMPTIFDQNTPKLRGYAAVTAQPVPTHGTAVPADVDIADWIYPGHGEAWHSAFGRTLLVSAPGYYDVGVDMDPNHPGRIRVDLDGRALGTFDVTLGGNVFTARVWLAAGQHGLSVVHAAAVGVPRGRVNHLFARVGGGAAPGGSSPRLIRTGLDFTLLAAAPAGAAGIPEVPMDRRSASVEGRAVATAWVRDGGATEATPVEDMVVCRTGRKDEAVPWSDLDIDWLPGGNT